MQSYSVQKFSRFFVLSLCLMLWAAFGFAQQQNVDESTSTSFTGLRFNRATRTFDTLGTITNTSTNTLAAPMSLVITNISDPGVSLANLSGTTPGGEPFVNVSVPNGTLAPGESVGNIVLKFNNLTRTRFTFTSSVLAGVNVLPQDDTPPSIYITSPPNGTVFSAQPITVVGTIDDNTATVTVNGVSANVSGGQFIANVPLPRDGTQIITAVGTDPADNTSQSSTVVALDTTPPTIVIDTPPNGFTTSDTTVAIAGLVSDVVDDHPSVTVNGIPAVVDNGSFIAVAVPLNDGPNLITAAATDGVGNIGTAVITVNRSTLPGLRLQILSGQGQSRLINTTLPSPLVVELLDQNGNPVSGRQVQFDVSRGDGTIDTSPPGGNPVRMLFVATDGNGQATVEFTLGTGNGAGNNRVQASVAGALPSFVEFCANGTSGAPDRINIISMSNQQNGVVNRPLAEPFEAVVSDDQGNPVAGALVTFDVTEGGGNFNGSTSTTVGSGADGIAKALLTLGPNPGTQNNVVTAAFAGQTDPPVEFVASGVDPGPVADTTFSGIVLDNGDVPLQNARAEIEGTGLEAFTDAEGRFQITGVPPGSQRLFIDGTSITDPLGRLYPNLEFDVNIFSGVDNSLGFPIYLPPLATDPLSSQLFTGPPATDVVLQMPGIPEATVTILAGTIVSDTEGPASPTNPITVTVSRVNNDRVPMPPPNGSVFLLAGTTQPAGVQFNPPAPVCVPNAGMNPGARVDIFSFDHDVGQFVSIGFASVSEDGSLICSDPGFGITKSGWYGCVPPPDDDTDAETPRVTINTTPICVCLGKTKNISATGTPAGGTYSWESNKLSVATVSGTGSSVTINGVGAGTATIKVTYTVTDGDGNPQQATDSASAIVVQVTIADTVGICKAKTKGIQITLNPSPLSAGKSVTLELSKTSGTGSATFDDGKTTKTINQTTTVNVKGVTESSTADNIKLVAKVDGQECASDVFSVIFVTLSTRSADTDTVSADNAARTNYNLARGTNKLGVYITSIFAGTGIEIVGTVSPSDFTGDIILKRTKDRKTYIGNTSLSDMAGGDTSSPALRDDDPQSGGSSGKIYDLDSPGFGLSSLASQPIGTILRYRSNFVQFAEFDSEKCSDDIKWFSRHSIRKSAAPNTWVRDNSVATDNDVGEGTTKLTADLQ